VNNLKEALMVRSRLALAALASLTLLPGSALAASSSSAPASCDACAAPFNDVDRGPFAHRDSIVGVAPYSVTSTDGKHTTTKLEGAVVRVRPSLGVTREWLQQAVNAHVSRMGQVGPMGDCPLSVSGASATVSSTGDGFAITISSPKNETAQEILRRASGLVGRLPSTS
jgi:hypothetical protein